MSATMRVRVGTLKIGTALVVDGARGTELQKRGLMQGCLPDERNVRHPEIVRAVSRSIPRGRRA
jgi:hypothetical protein